jgi:hypothetical protein
MRINVSYKTTKVAAYCLEAHEQALVDKYTVLKLVEQELLTLPEHLSSPAVFSGVGVLFVMFCRSLFVLLFFFFWPLCCLSFFNLHIWHPSC